MSRYLSIRNISFKSTHAFLSNHANRQTDRQTNKHGQKHVPPPLSEVNNRAYGPNCCFQVVSRHITVWSRVDRRRMRRYHWSWKTRNGATRSVVATSIWQSITRRHLVTTDGTMTTPSFTRPSSLTSVVVDEIDRLISSCQFWPFLHFSFERPTVQLYHHFVTTSEFYSTIFSNTVKVVVIVHWESIKKLDHFLFQQNFGKYCPILIILLLFRQKLTTTKHSLKSTTIRQIWQCITL